MTTPTNMATPVERFRITSDGNLLMPIGAKFGVAMQDTFRYDNKMQPHYGLQWTMDSWTGSGPTLWTSAYGGMKWFTRGLSRFVLTGDGNIGIGTEDTKGFKLAVNGDAMFTKIKVKTYATWPDYVFSDNYQLPALRELANYITQHKHLPEMPAAAEVEKDGMDVAEMNRLLLKKVEELTLYIIDQHKQLNEQQATAKKQDEILAKLQQEIAELKKQPH
ncbi:hypothetical protein F0L74_20945 [Chitinophaga agrisoli]|uniref:Uncharacterized protein n=1 Tax=Chitinophaga agrisoli TaxID=2607653 RepID=A0A5B2VKB4_9BACT|nr:hypothetical protein [Chitinophaga agrisoli]KAA2238689.1 hypothetical protein F0L74_20945 [Chitinophaga agrisoli]